MSAAHWAAALSDFEACLVEQEHRLAERRPDLVVAYTPPGDLGPLPAELGDRARALAERSNALEARVHGAMDATRRQVVLTRRIASDAAAVPAYLDQHA